MAHLAHSLPDDGLIRPQARRGRLALFARAANDNAPPGDLALTAWEQTSLTSYTPTGKVAQTTDPLGEATVTTYDAVDRPVFVTDAAGHVSGKTYDLAGEALSETSGVGTPLLQTDAAFTYGADGEKLSVTDANSNLTQLAYDGFNRLSKITYADKTTEASQYDKDGDLAIWTNRGGYGVVRCEACPRAGQRPDPGDALNRVVSESGITGASSAGQTLACPTGGTANTQPGGISPRTFTYDLAGRLTGAAIPNFPPGYTYDAAGRPSSRTVINAAYGWDHSGNLQTLTYPDGATTVTYQYDALNRMTGALIGGNSYGSLSYDALGRRQTLTFQDGSTQTWGYDAADHVTSIAHVFPNQTADNVTFTYGYDPAGREVSKTVDNSLFAYSPPATGTTAYGAANALNQYPTVGGYAYTYQPDGGLKETDTFEANYDELGKATVTYLTPTPGTVDPNNYDIQGIDALDHVYFHYRVPSAGATYPFVYHWTDGLRPETIQEPLCQQTQQTPQTAPVCTGTGLGNKTYVLGPDPDERWAMIGINGGTYNPHTDRAGTLIALSNGGNVSTIYAYDAYGQNASAANDASTGPAGYLYRYTGQRLDPNTGFYDYKARDYSPKLGRFIQPDPAGLDQGPNLYAYVGNDPVNAGDPDGMCNSHGGCGEWGGSDEGSSPLLNASDDGAQSKGQYLANSKDSTGNGPGKSDASQAFLSPATAAALRNVGVATEGAAATGASVVGAALGGLGIALVPGATASDDTADQYSVRVQVQGTIIGQMGRGDGNSVPIVQGVPVRVGQVHDALTLLYQRQSSSLGKMLGPAFVDASQWATRTAAAGGIGPIGNKTFPTRGFSATQLRVDIEIKRGPINIVP